MRKEEYIHAVTEQLRAHDFREIDRSEFQEDELSPEDLAIVEENRLFLKHPGEDVFAPKLETVVITKVEDKSVESLKETIRELSDDPTEETDGLMVDCHILLVSEEVTKPMETVVERNTTKEFAGSILPVLVDIENMTIHYEKPTGFGKSLSDIWELSQNVDEYFQGFSGNNWEFEKGN